MVPKFSAVPPTETFYLLLIYSVLHTVVYNNNFGLQGKLLWKFGPTERERERESGKQ